MKKLLLGLFCLYVTSVQAYVLIIPLYNETRQKRVQEYLTCLNINRAHDAIDVIHVLYDTSKDGVSKQHVLRDALEDDEKTVVSYINRRQTLGDCIRIANEQYAGHVVIISNADIYFNETLHALDQVLWNDVFLTLTRWDVGRNGQLIKFLNTKGKPAIGSQDTWIGKAPFKKFAFDGIALGTARCDNRIAFQAQQCGYRIYNPYWSVQCCHVHASGLRSRDRNRITGKDRRGVVGVPWCTVEDIQ